MPDGKFILGTPLKALKSGSQVQTTWDVATCTSADYNLYYGTLGNYSAFNGGVCALGTSGTTTFFALDNSWWVIAGVNGASVSAFGETDTGANEMLTQGLQGINRFCTCRCL